MTIGEGINNAGTIVGWYMFASGCSPECSYKTRLERRKQLRRLKREARATRERVTCKHCGQPFVPKRDDARYCSAACKQAAYRQRFNFLLVNTFGNNRELRI
jgi:hypothetical protein